MKIVLMSMPDVAPVIMHTSAFHMANNGLANIAANLDGEHDVYIIDLIRKRRRVVNYVTQTLLKYRPDMVGLSSMTWQYATCTKLLKLIKRLLPDVKTVIGGYHATLMYKEIADSKEADWIDFIIRGEGEVAFSALINAVGGHGRYKGIPSLSFKDDAGFCHNPKGEPLDLAQIKLPVRDKRRTTSGYHVMNRKVEVMETSRGCTRSCHFCSMHHMYGRIYRTFPIDRILADIDTIYHQRHTRRIFITDDNMVLAPNRVIELCEAIIARKYRRLQFSVQADCITISKNETMVRKMAQAGFKLIFLGIENVSSKNLKTAGKGNIVNASRQAVAICHKYGIMVLGGMIFGFPDDEEADIIANYRFLKEIEADSAYCQILTPYPKTDLRRTLMAEGLVTNPDNFTKYNGMWANIKTRHLDAQRLQYLFWLHRRKVLGWWEPSKQVREQGRLATSIWVYALRPLLKFIEARTQKRSSLDGRYQQDMLRLAEINQFKDLEA